MLPFNMGDSRMLERFQAIKEDRIKEDIKSLVKATLDIRPEIVTTQHITAEGEPCRVVILFKAPLFYASGLVARRDSEELPMVLKGASEAITYQELLIKMHEYWYCRLLKPNGELDRFLQESGHYLKRLVISDESDDKTENGDGKEVKNDVEAKIGGNQDGPGAKTKETVPISAISIPDFEEWAKQSNAPQSAISILKRWTEEIYTPRSAVPMSAISVPNFEEWAAQSNGPNSAISAPGFGAKGQDPNSQLYVPTLEDWVKRNENVLVPVSTKTKPDETASTSTLQEAKKLDPDLCPELIPLPL
ncbi:hypothetical protein K491DRAFT_85288 [Lophiostoma macrostomum CBS 122681]|uniref:Uncharacterized protein n=1 Tax=Lophiostoma macrostomum CBS 122681 TaxID=1314788 RepID=A0A6A6SX73_9PLEO|nr:hypothetical protein K491DRAFT_85288 [Lophiostoma macrostomum CBS 122681]